MKKLKQILKKYLQKLLALIKRENTVYYINGPETLPPPLTKQDEEIIFKKITDGDDSVREEL
ncbi:MAG: sporulation sigma factor SigE, partial [Acutalibacteraceae bacterium]